MDGYQVTIMDGFVTSNIAGVKETSFEHFSRASYA